MNNIPDLLVDNGIQAMSKDAKYLEIEVDKLPKKKYNRKKKMILM